MAPEEPTIPNLSPAEESKPYGSLQLQLRTKTKKKKKTNNKPWRTRSQHELGCVSSSHESLFLNMQLRKMNRAMTGTKTRSMKPELISLAVFLVIVYSTATKDSSAAGEAHDSHRTFITLGLGQVVAIGIWLYLAVTLTSLFRESNFIALLYWMLIYLPLMAMITTFMFDGPASTKLEYFTFDDIIGILLAVAEVLAVIIFVGLYYAYPKFVSSKWFRRTGGARTWWKVQLVSDWTMTYVGRRRRLFFNNKRFTCKYNGETNQQGLPHGFGRWLDDSFDGEVLTGSWKDGHPVAPFFSRHYGRGDAFGAVRIAYIMASDDDFTSNKFWPSNEKSPRCGIVSVECSVSGAFYNELPYATHLYGPHEAFGGAAGGGDNGEREAFSVEDLCRKLHHMGEEQDANVVHIRADPTGVHVKGHIYEPTGQAVDAHVDQILVQVNKHDNNEQNATNTSQKKPRWDLNFMPVSHERSFMLKDEQVMIREDTGESDPSDAEGSVAMTSEHNLEEAVSEAEQLTKNDPNISLKIQDWVPTIHKEALIYFPGFNSCQKHSLETLGQFIAMTKLDAHIYPICFAWPNAQVLSYHSASRAAVSERNKSNLCQLLKGLLEAGIRTVHLMSHSMGVQALVGAFEDKADGSRSDVSFCFRLSGDYNDHPESVGRENIGVASDKNMLYCKTLTMLNPDFPLDAFVDRGFRSVRRICSTITVVADRNDGALFWSQLINGIAVSVGYEQPTALRPSLQAKEEGKRKLPGYQRVVGKNVESLHLPLGTEEDALPADVPIFRNRASVMLRSDDEEVQERQWLDMDMIDTTGLDTNIAGIRHSAFNINPILFKDLEELITTGRRASKRSALLYREGNIFSYCHAPSFVVIN